MKKIPVSQQAKEPEQSASADFAQAQTSETDDPMAGLQADLDRFRDLALRSQADFENYKKRAAREKEEAIRYANSSLLERLVTIIDNFELGLEAAKGEGERSPIFSGMTLVLKQLNDFLRENGLFTFVRWNTCFVNPPLTITEQQLREGLAIIDRGLEIVDQAVA